MSWVQQPMGPRLESSDEEDDDEPQMRLPAGYASALGGLVHRSQQELTVEWENGSRCSHDHGDQREDQLERLRAHATEVSLRRHDESDDEDQQQLQLLRAATIADNMHVWQLPVELVVNVFSHLQTMQDLLAVQQVCQQWRDLRLPDEAWRAAACCSLSVLPALWLRHGKAESDGLGMRALCIRLHIALGQMRERWQAEHSLRELVHEVQWAADGRDSTFLIWLAFALRIWQVSAPADFRQRASLAGLPSLQRSEYLAVHLMDRIVNRGLGAGDDAFLARVWGEDPASEAEAHLDSWWGDERREELLPALFDMDALVELLEGLLRANERPSLLTRLLLTTSALAREGVEYCASAAFSEFPGACPGRPHPAGAEPLLTQILCELLLLAGELCSRR